MAKINRSGQKANTAMEQSYGVKNGSVRKNKNPKFKNELMNKVALISNSNAKNKNAASPKTSQKDIAVKNRQFSKNNPKQSKGKQNFQEQNSQSKLSNKKSNSKELKLKKIVLDDSDSEEMPLDVSMSPVEMFQDEDSDTDVPDIFGESLRDESDEDDKDFDFEVEEEKHNNSSNSETEKIGHKGIKMFGGMQSKNDQERTPKNYADSSLFMKVEDTSEDEDEDEDEDESEDEDEEVDDEDENKEFSLEALLGNSIVDDDDDEDFNEEDEDDEDDEDDDISDENEDGNAEDMTKIIKRKALDNKDTKGDEQKMKKKKQLSPEEQEEIDKKTIFINNIPKETNATDIKKVFCQFGPINNLRFRSIVPENSKLSKKVAAIKRQIHPKVTTVTVYVNYKSEESARKALDMNGKIFQGNYIHVQIVAESAHKRFDNKKAVFLGNLKFGTDNNTIWKRFSQCGDIESVYLMRDSETGQTKGSGYVNFKTEHAATLALKLNGTEILNRPIRVHAYLSGGKKQKKNKKGRKRSNSKAEGNKSVKKVKNNLGEPAIVGKSKVVGEAKKQHQESQKNHGDFSEKKQSFQGQKADTKNKKHRKKPNEKKKEMAKKLLAKSKISKKA